jgi:hypothetical protein
VSLHLDDIKLALDRGHLSTIEDSFRALIGWPDEAEIGGTDAAGRCSLLERICQALKEDDRQMPGNIVAVIEDSGCKLYGGSYRNGAGAVLADLDRWRYIVGGPA